LRAPVRGARAMIRTRATGGKRRESARRAGAVRGRAQRYVAQADKRRRSASASESSEARGEETIKPSRCNEAVDVHMREGGASMFFAYRVQ